jgi:aryl-alcohol dehydrogenase-like predicted oxidoreductase
VGISNFCGWQTGWAVTRFEALTAAAGLFGCGVASTQVEYSLLRREVEREVLPAARALGLGVLPYSPLGRGVLTGKYRHGTPADSRAASAEFAERQREYLQPRARAIVDAVCRAADGLDLSPAEVALAWLRDRPGVTAPIVGARTAAQLRDSLGVERVELPETIAVALDEVSRGGVPGRPVAAGNGTAPKKPLPIDTHE